MSDNHPLPPTWVVDQARAWRISAAIWDHDGNLFDMVIRETRGSGDDGTERLIAALARNLVVRLRMSIGEEALDALIPAELEACATEPMRELPVGAIGLLPRQEHGRGRPRCHGELPPQQYCAECGAYNPDEGE
ncbi:hypothetical protein [Mycolicibacterium mageritense]|nr:hypothetical protein [Mycolicibacterium mageritense]